MYFLRFNIIGPQSIHYRPVLGQLSITWFFYNPSFFLAHYWTFIGPIYNLYYDIGPIMGSLYETNIYEYGIGPMMSNLNGNNIYGYDIGPIMASLYETNIYEYGIGPMM